MKDYIIKENDLSIRKLSSDIKDLTMLTDWRNDIRISTYYGGRDINNTLDSVKEKYLPRIEGKENITPLIIELDEKESGYIQYYSVTKEKYITHKLEDYNNAYGIDIFIAPDVHGKGLGVKALRLLSKYLFNTLKADIVEITPRSENKRAVHSYEKAGFTPYALLEKGEFFEGKWREEIIMIKTKE